MCTTYGTVGERASPGTGRSARIAVQRSTGTGLACERPHALLGIHTEPFTSAMSTAARRADDRCADADNHPRSRSERSRRRRSGASSREREEPPARSRGLFLSRRSSESWRDDPRDGPVAGHLQVSLVRAVERIRDCGSGPVRWVSPGPPPVFPFIQKGPVRRGVGEMPKIWPSGTDLREALQESAVIGARSAPHPRWPSHVRE